MAFDILKKEEEFYAINSKLEMRTKELLKEVNTVMVNKTLIIWSVFVIKTLILQKIQDNLPNINLRDDKTIPYARISDNIFVENDTNVKHVKYINPSQNTVQNSKGDPNIPESVNNMGTKAINHYFRSKINTMQNEYDKLHNEFRKKVIGEKQKYYQIF